MKTASPAMQGHLQQDSTTLAYLWKVTRQDGQVFCFTTHDEDIIYPPSSNAQMALNGGTAPPPPVLSSYTPALSTADIKTGGSRYVKTTYISNTEIPGGTTESSASPEVSIVLASGQALKVQSPPAPGGGATAYAYNVYALNIPGAEQLQNAVPIPLGTDWNEPATGLVNNRGIDVTPTFTMKLRALTSGFTGGVDGGSVSGAIAAYDFDSEPPASAAVLSNGQYTLVFSGGFSKFTLGPTPPPPDPAHIARARCVLWYSAACGGGYFTAGPINSEAAAVTVGGAAGLTAAIRNSTGAPTGYLFSIIREIHDFVPLYYAYIYDFYQEVVYELSDALAPGGAASPQNIYLNKFSNTAKQSGSNL